MKLLPQYLAMAGALLLASCGGLPRPLRNEIQAENERLQQAEKRFARSRDAVREDLAHARDLFDGASVSTEWPARFRAAQAKLDAAENDRRELAGLQHAGGKDAAMRAERLLSDERHQRQSAIDEAEAIESAATRWLDFQRNLPHYLAKMQGEYDAIRAVDLAPVAKTVAKAEQDWPAKKTDLDQRLTALQQAPERAEAQWRTTESARQAATSGKAGGPQIAALIQADDVLAKESANLTASADQLRGMCDQLYDAWDKILADLDVSREGSDTVYRERVKTVRTHLLDVAEKKTQISSDETWQEVSPASYRVVENDLGMAIAHKDAGLFDSEAQNTAQPAGFGYIAPPSQGSNQYGYWTHDGSGTFWTFLPQYLLMRELLWGHDYRPIVVHEYYGYQAAQRSGRTYYGQETPASRPKYGSHGTFTEQRYAGSRYLQSGGFRGSAYAAHGAGAPSPSASLSHPDGHSSRPADDRRAGHRFGSSSDSPAGQRFGGGSRSSSAPGKGFGSRGGSRPAIRSGGRRR